MRLIAKNLLLAMLLLPFLAVEGAAESVLLQGVVADKVLVEKAQRRLTLLANGQVLKSYRVALGGNPVGAKEKLGDQRTPEGNYIIDWRKPDSRFHLALRISYPGPEDLERAARQGVSPGGDIMIHGLQNGLEGIEEFHSLFDWTQGCIAVTNPEIEEIWRLVPEGTPVEIRP
jgi:murein L,D-transpeptidase YafK